MSSDEAQGVKRWTNHEIFPDGRPSILTEVVRASDHDRIVAGHDGVIREFDKRIHSLVDEIARNEATIAAKDAFYDEIIKREALHYSNAIAAKDAEAQALRNMVSYLKRQNEELLAEIEALSGGKT